MNATTLWIKVYAYDECLLIFDTSKKTQSYWETEREGKNETCNMDTVATTLRRWIEKIVLQNNNNNNNKDDDDNR